MSSTSWKGTRALLWLTCASILTYAQDERDYTAACPATYRFRQGSLSGGGHLFEYYHFLIDFAPRVLEAFEAMDERCDRISILAPPKLSGMKRVFMLELNEGASMKAQLAAVFEPQWKIEVEPWLGHGRDPIPAVLPGKTIEIPPEEEWSMQPRLRLERSRPASGGGSLPSSGLFPRPARRWTDATPVGSARGFWTWPGTRAPSIEVSTS